MLAAAQAQITPTTTVLGVLGILLSLPAWFLFLRGAWRMYRLIGSGQPSPGRIDRPLRRFGQMLKEVFLHPDMLRKPAVGIAHWFVMVGFMFGAVVWFEAYIQTFDPAGGWPWLGGWVVYRFIEEILALGTILGILLLIGVRLKLGRTERGSRFYGSDHTAARVIEAVVLIEGLGMLAVKAGKIATFGGGDPVADFVSVHLAALLPASATMVSIFALVKLLGGMFFLIIIARYLTWGVAWHRFLAFFNIFFQRNATGEKALGKIRPMVSNGRELTLDNVDDDDTLGVGTLPDASWKMLLDAATCTDCGRCQEQCPAWHTDKPLSPKLLMTDIRAMAMANASYLMDPSALKADESHAGLDVLKLVGETETIHPDVLWSCTNCGACVEQCPVDIEHIDHITDLRRFQVLAESEFPSELTGMFKNLETKGNPWGRNTSERASWVTEARRDGLEVPVVGEDVTDFADTEYLFWVGCAGAYDEEGKKTTRAVVDLLATAGVKYAVLSTGETCTGDPARRAGNEFLFQMLASENIDTLNGVFEGVPDGQRKIITTCPHCFNTIRNEYPDFGGNFDVFHHTQLLNRLVRDKRLTPVPRGPENRKPITYHDPCFLGRHNKVFDPPRELLGATGMELREMDRNRNEGFCCGAGGARMFMEEKIGTRVNENRSAEALSTGAEEIAVGCPFCNVMIDNGVKALSDASAADRPQVRDVARMLRDSVLVDGALPTPHEKSFLERPLRLTPVKKEETAATTTAAPAVTKPGRGVAKGPGAGDSPVGQAPGASSSLPAAPGAAPIPPAPGAATPTAPGAPAAPGAVAPGAGPAVPPVPTVPGAPGATAPGAVPPAPGAPGAPGATAPGAVAPAAPKAPGTPGVATPGIVPPGAAAPGAVTPPAPGAATPHVPPAPGVPGAPGVATPTAPGAAAPGSVPPGATAPGASTPPTPPAPGIPGAVAPGAAAPGVVPPGAGTPSAPNAPSAPGGAIPQAPGSATPPVPTAPGATPPGAVTPGASPDSGETEDEEDVDGR